MPGFESVPAFGHRRGNGALARRNDESLPACHRPRRASSPSSLLAPPVAQRIDDVADLARVALADFVQGKQAIVEQRRRAFHAVGGRTPTAPIVRTAPDGSSRLKNGCLAGRRIANEVQPAALGIAARQQRPGECSRQAQGEQWIADSARRDFGTPAGKRSGLAVFLVPTFAALENHARLVRPDHIIRKNEHGTTPADLQRATNLLFRRSLLQVARKVKTSVRVNGQSHSEQFAPQFFARSAQQFHRHGPITPAARRVHEAQQPPEVVAGTVGGLCFDVQRPAYPGIHWHGRFAFLGCAHGVIPDARLQLAPAFE